MQYDLRVPACKGRVPAFHGLWLSGDFRATFPGVIGGYGFADGLTYVVYRGYLGYTPGFRVYAHYVGCKTELLSSVGNITHSTSVVLLLLLLGVLLGHNLHLFNLYRRASRVVDSLR